MFLLVNGFLNGTGTNFLEWYKNTDGFSVQPRHIGQPEGEQETYWVDGYAVLEIMDHSENVITLSAVSDPPSSQLSSTEHTAE